MYDETDLFLAIFVSAMFFGFVFFLVGLDLGLTNGREKVREEAQEAGVGCYERLTGEFQFDAHCPKKGANNE
jgi:hypothetical protein